MLPALLVAVLLAACSSEPAQDPSTASNPPTQRRLDASKYMDKEHICDLLTDDQAVNLGFPRDERSPYAGKGGARCLRGKGPHPNVSYLLWLTDNPVQSRIDEYGSDKFHEVTSLTISGQPAVQARSDPGMNPMKCIVVMDLAERQAVEILVSYDERNPCEVAVAVAEQMVRNLGG